MATYAAAKAFVLHFTEALKFELRGRGVQVMAVCPGPTATSFFEGVSTKMKDGGFDSAELESILRTSRQPLRPSERDERCLAGLPKTPRVAQNGRQSDGVSSAL
jgi:short-subunit dehydrogenase